MGCKYHIADYVEKIKMAAVTCKHGVIAYTEFVNIEIFRLFRHNQQYDTLLPVTPCKHKLKAGIAYWNKYFNCSFSRIDRFKTLLCL